MNVDRLVYILDQRLIDFAKLGNIVIEYISCSITNNFVVKGNMSIKYVRFNYTIFNMFRAIYKQTFIFTKIAMLKNPKSFRNQALSPNN